MTSASPTKVRKNSPNSQPPETLGELGPPKPPRRNLRGCLGMLLPPVREMAGAWRSLAWALGSVVLLRLTFTPVNWWPLGFVALVPWLWGLRKTTPRLAFWLSWVFGSVHFLTVFTWMASLSRFNSFIYLGIPLACLFQGFFYAVNGAGLVFFARRMPTTFAMLAGALWWAGWEWFRSVGPLGNPYALIGHTVGGFLPLVQIVSIGGVYLLSALLVLANLCVMECIAATVKKAWDIGVAARAGGVVAVIVVACIWGGLVMRPDQDSIPVRVAVLQPNVSQDEKFASYASGDMAKMEELTDQFTRLMLRMIDEIEPGAADIIVTPESAFTQIHFEAEVDLQRELRERAAERKATIVFGANDLVFVDEDGKFTENIDDGRVNEEGFKDFEMCGGYYVLKPDEQENRLKADYRKVHLMPFGETLPYFNLIPGLQDKVVQIGLFLAGDNKQPPIHVPIQPPAGDPLAKAEQIQIGPTICFEDLFSSLHRRRARQGTQLFINITNNAWFDPSLGSEYHYRFALFRAAETRLPMILCTNSGVSAAVDSSMRVIERMPVREEAAKIFTVQVPRNPGVTIYSRLGDWFGILGWVGAISVMIALARRSDPSL